MAGDDPHITRAVRFIYGTPEDVEAQLVRLEAYYLTSNLFFYVVKDELRVCASLLNKAEVERQQSMNRLMLVGQRMRPN